MTPDADLYCLNAAERFALQAHGWRWSEDMGRWVRISSEAPMDHAEAREWLRKKQEGQR